MQFHRVHQRAKVFDELSTRRRRFHSPTILFAIELDLGPLEILVADNDELILGVLVPLFDVVTTSSGSASRAAGRPRPRCDGPTSPRRRCPRRRCVDVPGVLKRWSISYSGDGPTSPGGAAVDRAGGGSGRWLSLSWWWACEARRGRSGRGSSRCSGLSVVRGRLRGRR